MKSSGILSIIDSQSACHPQKREKLKTLSNGQYQFNLDTELQRPHAGILGNT